MTFSRRNFLKTGAVLAIGKPMSDIGLDSHASDLKEPVSNLPVGQETDVIVCGGGPAGFAAAVSAARNGARVKLIELKGCLGGIWTSGLMTNFIDHDNKRGIMKELLAIQHNADVIKPKCLDVEITKLWLEKFCMDAGVDLLYHTRVVDAKKERGRLTTVITENSKGRQAWKAKIFIDTTGNGDLAARAGCGFDIGHPESGLTQPLSLCVLIGGINLKDLQDHRVIRMPDMTWAEHKDNLLAEIQRGGADCSYSKPTFFSIRHDLFSLMSNHQYKVNALDAAEITRATIEARAELHWQIDALRSLGGIWKNIRIVATADQIGIRESRRIHGLYTVSKDDLIKGTHFSDAVCRATFCVDIHALDPSKNKGIEEEDFHSKPYDIPLRSLIAKDVNGLMMAGRCISGDFFAHASYRVTGNAVAMGEAAGQVAARAALENKLPQEITYKPV
jgi:FAD dependent oxidoreductase